MHLWNISKTIDKMYAKMVEKLYDEYDSLFRNFTNSL